MRLPGLYVGWHLSTRLFIGTFPASLLAICAAELSTAADNDLGSGIQRALSEDTSPVETGRRARRTRGGRNCGLGKSGRNERLQAEGPEANSLCENLLARGWHGIPLPTPSTTPTAGRQYRLL